MLAYLATYETTFAPGNVGRNGSRVPWRVMCTFLEMRFESAADATAWAEMKLGALPRSDWRGGAVPYIPHQES